MMQPLKIFVGLFTGLVSFAAMAAPACTPTASIPHYDYPGAELIPTTNNLLLPTGKPIPVEGQSLMIKGSVRDSECKPVPEAVVELWQAGPLGVWHIPSRADRASVQPVFAGAGRTYTDQDGNFYFVTAFPAPSRYKTPNINIRVRSTGISGYTSALFFDGDERNSVEPVYQKLSATDRKDISIKVEPGAGVELIGTVNLVLPDKAPYRVY